MIYLVVGVSLAIIIPAGVVLVFCYYRQKRNARNLERHQTRTHTNNDNGSNQPLYANDSYNNPGWVNGDDGYHYLVEDDIDKAQVYDKNHGYANPQEACKRENYSNLN